MIITDVNGGPVANVSVTFEVTAGGGTVIPASVMTDAAGVAPTSGWVLGSSVGANQLMAKTPGLTPITFSASATAGLPASIVAEAGTTPQTGVVGTAVPVPPSVVVKDALGNPVAGVSVVFSGAAGSVVPSAVVTDANGRASATWTLGTISGAQTISAQTSTLAPVKFSATAVVGPATKMVVSPASVTLMPTQTSVLVATFSDNYGNRIDNPPAVSFSSSNQSVATVASSGLVTAIAAGAATISTSAGTFSQSIPVTVVATIAAPTRVNGLTGRPFGVRMLNDATALVTRQDVNQVTRVDLAGMTPGASLPTGSDPSDISLDATATYGYVPNVLGGSVSIVRLATNSLETSIAVSGSPFRALVSTDGQRVYVGQNNGQIAVIQTATRTIATSFLLTGAINGLAQTGDGRTLYASSMSGLGVPSEAADGQVLASKSVGGTAQEVVLSPDGSEVYVANEGGWVDVLDANTLNQKQRVTVASLFGMALSPDGAKLWVSATLAGKVFTIDRATMTVSATYTVTGLPRRIAFTSTGIALVANEAGWLDVFR